MQTYEPEVGDSVVCNPDLPQEVFQACGLSTDQTYEVTSVHTDPHDRDTYVNVRGEDGKMYENYGLIFFVKRIFH